MTSRNDDHGGDMLRRFKIFAEALLEQANRHALSGELVVVEWNPPPGPRLHDLLKLSVKSKSFAIRFIEVPLEAHRAIRNSDIIPLFQMIAKNVGIRRAKGDFIIATNPDLLFSESVIAFLAAGNPSKSLLYRIDRHDVPSNIPENATIEQQLAWCDAHVLRVHRRRGSFPPKRRFLARFSLANPLKWYNTILALGRKIELHARSQWLVCKFRLKDRQFGTIVLESLKSLASILAKSLSMWLTATVFHLRHLSRRILWGLLQLIDPLPKVHTNACGDFTLMSHDRWFELRGYPELPLWSMHLDSLLCYMAVALGTREQVLRSPAKIFHMEHDNSWVVMSPDQRLKTFAVKPWIDVGLLSEIWHAMYEKRRPINFNNEDWGLADWELDEVCITSGEKRFIKKDNANDLKVG